MSIRKTDIEYKPILSNVHSQENLNTESDDSIPTVEEALDRIGHGRYQWWLLACISWAISSDTVEIVGLSFVFPLFGCQFGATNIQKGLLNAAVFLGMMIGGLVWGSLGDIWGRRKVLTFSLLLNGAAAVASTLMPVSSAGLWSFIGLRLLSGVGVGGSYPSAFAFLAEWQPSSNRGRALGLLCSCWMLAGSFTAGLAWAVLPGPLSPVNMDFRHGWRLFLVICTLPAFSAALLVRIMLPDSPRFLVQNHREKEAVAVINRLASFNQSDEHFTQLRCQGPSTSLNTDSEPFPSALKQLKEQLSTMTSRRYRRPVALIIIINFTLAFGYYGLLLWLPQLYARIEQYGGTICAPTQGANNETVLMQPCSDTALSSSKPYWEALIVNVANLPGNLISVLLIERVGRRLMLCFSMLLTAAALIFVPFLNSEAALLAVTAVFGGVSAAGWNSLSAVSSEVVPTAVRSSTLGFSQGLSRLGAILGNLMFGALIDVHCSLPLLVGGATLVVGGLCGLLLPVTTGRHIH